MLLQMLQQFGEGGGSDPDLKWLRCLSLCEVRFDLGRLETESYEVTLLKKHESKMSSNVNLIESLLLWCIWCIEFEKDDVSILNNVVSSLLSVFSSRL